MKSSLFFPAVKTPMHALDAVGKTFDEQVELKDPTDALKFFENTKLQSDASIAINLHDTNVQNSNAAIKKNGKLSSFSFQSAVNSERFLKCMLALC